MHVSPFVSNEVRTLSLNSTYFILFLNSKDKKYIYIISHRERQINITIKYHYSFTNMAKMKKTIHTLIVKNVEKLELITYWGKDWRLEEMGGQMMRCLGGIIDSVNTSLSKLGRQWRKRKTGVLQSIG